MGRFIGRMHAVAARGRFEHRPTLTMEAWAVEPARYLLDGGFVAAHVEQRFEDALDQLLPLITEVGHLPTPPRDRAAAVVAESIAQLEQLSARARR